jgi:hypothetical protein
MSLLELFCAVDDFCKAIDEEQARHLLGSSTQQRQRAGQLIDSEALTIMIHFHKVRIATSKPTISNMCRYIYRVNFPSHQL